MGFFRKSPPPAGEPNDNLSTQSPAHTHTWWDDRGNKQQTRCTCDTGRDHTTPREGR